MNRRYVNWTSTLWVYLIASLLLLIASPVQADGYRLPQFREVPGSPAKLPEMSASETVSLIGDADFAPYSFVSQGGGPAGMAVELALAACTEAKLRCEIKLMAFDQLLPALAQGTADLVISGPRLDQAANAGAFMTRPWFRTMARFAVLSGSPLTASTAPALRGKRIGVAKDTLHARWLETYYGASEIVTFDDDARAREALRTGGIEAYFGDNLLTIYWVAGPAAQGCCRLLDGAYTDFDHFSRNLAFLTARDDLRAAFDFGLDAAQQKGITEKIFNTYVPLSPW